MTIYWTTWNELPWLSSHDSTASVIQLCDRLLESSLNSPSATAFLHDELPEIATEFSLQWVAVIHKTPNWKIVAECGRHPLDQLPYSFFEDALDRVAGAAQPCNSPPDWSIAAIPLQSADTAGQLLLLAGRNFAGDLLPMAMAVGRTLSYCIDLSQRQARDSARIDRFRKTLEISSGFSAVHETQPLLEHIAEEATHLVDCDRASIFVWDREQHQVVACPALGVEGGTLRLPDNTGIVGEVIHNSRTILVDDAYTDSRFDSSVDKSSGYTTRNLLCVPLLDAEGQLIGAFEGINKNDGSFSEDDEESLKLLGTQAAIALQNTQEREQLVRSREHLTEQLTQGMKIIGESPAIVALRDTIERLAATDLPVLILGESGTGKEVASSALHYLGNRADHPFVAVNCAALTETLLESELFGHEKGSFTDAHEMRQGKFELADGGTLFLDEIGDMSLGGQAKLLRVLEQKVITRVGGEQTIPTNVRVIAATNAELAEAVREKKFRQDLYFRLSVVTLDLPPLRERPEDILLLADHFLAQFGRQANRPQLQLSPDARRRLQAHGWPGNVRELRNLMERVAFLAPGIRVEADDLAFILSPARESVFDMSADLTLTDATQRFQQEFIQRSIKRVKGNMSEAAKLLGLHRSNLYRKMRQLEMRESDDVEDE